MNDVRNFNGRHFFSIIFVSVPAGEHWRSVVTVGTLPSLSAVAKGLNGGSEARRGEGSRGGMGPGDSNVFWFR